MINKYNQWMVSNRLQKIRRT